MKKYWLLSLTIIFLAIGLCLPQSGSRAQDFPELKPGEFVMGAFTNAAKTVKYTFSGKKDEQYCVTFAAVSSKENVDSSMSIEDGKGKTLANNDFGGKLFVTLPADGNYILTVSRRFSTNGPFALKLHPVIKLEPGQKAEVTITLQQLVDDGSFVGSGAYLSAQSKSDFRVTVTSGEIKTPQGFSAFVAYTVFQGGDTLYTASGVDKVMASSLTLKSGEKPYQLAIHFSGYYSTSKITKDDKFEQKYTVAVDGLSQ